MSHVRLFYHIVFVTKHRADTIPEQKERILFKYIHTICMERGITLIRINGTPCHIHMLVSIPPTACLSDFVRDIKRSTSMMLKRTSGFGLFDGWSREYSCDTVSFHHVDVIKRYIINQKEHHKAVDLVDELSSIFNQDVAFNKEFDGEHKATPSALTFPDMITPHSRAARVNVGLYTKQPLSAVSPIHTGYPASGGFGGRCCAPYPPPHSIDAQSQAP